MDRQTDQTRAEQSRADQSRSDQIRSDRLISTVICTCLHVHVHRLEVFFLSHAEPWRTPKACCDRPVSFLGTCAQPKRHVGAHGTGQPMSAVLPLHLSLWDFKNGTLADALHMAAVGSHHIKHLPHQILRCAELKSESAVVASLDITSHWPHWL